MGTLQQLKNSILISIHGRKVGIDANDFLVGLKDMLRPIQTALTSGTTATAVTNYGITAFDITTAAASTASSIGTTEVGCSWTMDAPTPGVQKILFKMSTTGGSTAPVIVEFGTGVTAYNTSLGSTFTGVNLTGVGQYCVLTGVTTAQWLVTAAGTGTSLASSN